MQQRISAKAKSGLMHRTKKDRLAAVFLTSLRLPRAADPFSCMLSLVSAASAVFTAFTSAAATRPRAGNWTGLRHSASARRSLPPIRLPRALLEFFPCTRAGSFARALAAAIEFGQFQRLADALASTSSKAP